MCREVGVAEHAGWGPARGLVGEECVPEKTELRLTGMQGLDHST